MEKIKKWMLKKEEGLSTFVSTLICIACILAFFMAMVYAYTAALAENDIQRINKKYILAMEREGYLNGTDLASLQAELAAYGATNVDLSGTSMSEVGYGNRVVLRIECDIPVSTLVNFRREGSTRHVVVEKDGTALY